MNVMENLTSNNSAPNYNKSVTMKAEALTIVMLISVMALGIFGNSLVIASFFKFRYLRMVTNYFLVSLAVADLMLASFSMPFWLIIRLADLMRVPRDRLDYMILYYSWQYLDILCSTASITNLCVIAKDRHMAIVSPLRYYAKMTPKRALISIAVGWSYAAICAGISMISIDRNIQPIAGRVYAVFISLAAFFIPLLIILIYYGRIFAVALTQIKRLSHQGSLVYGAEKERRTLMQRELKLSKTLAIVVGTFVVCWSPFFVILILFAVCSTSCVSSASATTYIAVSKWMHYSSTTANPIIYTLFTKGFRQAFKSMLNCSECKSRCCCCIRKKMKNQTGSQLRVWSSYECRIEEKQVQHSCSLHISR